MDWKNLTQDANVIEIFEREGWTLTKFAHSRSWQAYDGSDNEPKLFDTFEAAQEYADNKIEQRQKNRRTPTFSTFSEILTASPHQLASEYKSLLIQLQKGLCGEFSSIEVMIRYMKVVSALGMFQHEKAFTRALGGLRSYIQ